VHQAVAGRTQNSGSHPTGGGLRRLSVYADSIRVDLALPAAVPIGSLIPPIVEILTGEGRYDAGPVAIQHQLSLPGNIALDPSKTLAQVGIRDGSILILTGSSTELTAPRFDDAAEAVSVLLAETVRPWTRRAARLIGALEGSCLASVTAAVLLRTMFDTNDPRRTGSAGVAATVGFLTLLAAVIACRVFRDRSAGLTLGLLASGFAAIAGLLAVPGGPGAPNALFATAAAATSAAVMRAIGCCAVIFTALACFTTVGAAAALVGAITAVPLQAIGAAVAAISLVLVEVSAPMSIMLAGLSPQPASDPDATRGDPMLCPHRLSAKAIRAYDWLTSLVVGFSASAALGAIGAVVGLYLAGGQSAPGIAFATITGGVLLFRARSHRELARSVPLIVSGTAALSAALVVAAAAYPLHTPHVAAASMLLAAVALCLGFINHTVAVSPVGRRSVELLEYLGLAVVVPLTCWICGLYGAARGLNLP
jgi:type VII secretion integral membrane protein EccD